MVKIIFCKKIVFKRITFQKSAARGAISCRKAAGFAASPRGAAVLPQSGNASPTLRGAARKMGNSVISTYVMRHFVSISSFPKRFFKLWRLHRTRVFLNADFYSILRSSCLYEALSATLSEEFVHFILLPTAIFIPFPHFPASGGKNFFIYDFL